MYEPIPLDPSINIRKLRDQLDARHISLKSFAESAELAYVFFRSIMCGLDEPGQLARIKIAAAAQRYGLKGVVGNNRPHSIAGQQRIAVGT